MNRNYTSNAKMGIPGRNSSVWSGGGRLQVQYKYEMLKTQGGQKVLSKDTKTTTRNGVTETVVTEVVQLPDGTIKTLRTTTTSGTTTNHSSSTHTAGQHHVTSSHKTTKTKTDKHKSDSDDEHHSNKLATSFNKVLHFRGSDSKDKSTSSKPSQVKTKEHSKVHHSNRSSSSSSDSDSSDDEDFAETCLKWHNHYRGLHGVPPLARSKTMNKYAKQWAQKLAREDSFRHRDERTYGENIYMQWSSNKSFKIDGKAPVESWYSEIKDHKFGVDRPSSLAAGHFTQVVWKESKTLGVGKARSKSGKILVVCNYDPPGNMLGKYAANVLQHK